MRKLTIPVILSALAVILAGSLDHPSTAGESAQPEAFRHSIQMAKAGPYQMRLCGSCDLMRFHVDKHGFAHFNLGYPVADWFPVDIGEDGRWELAITIAGPPTRVGIYDPHIETWIDGPRELPVEPGYWGAGDWTKDGFVDYVYVAGRLVRVFDGSTLQDTAVWRCSFNPRSLNVWGRDSGGRALLGIEELRPEYWTDY